MGDKFLPCWAISLLNRNEKYKKMSSALFYSPFYCCWEKEFIPSGQKCILLANSCCLMGFVLWNNVPIMLVTGFDSYFFNFYFVWHKYTKLISQNIFARKILWRSYIIGCILTAQCDKEIHFVRAHDNVRSAYSNDFFTMLFTWYKAREPFEIGD